MNKKSKLQEIRDGFVASIKDLLVKHQHDNFDVTDCGSTPIIWPSPDDQDFDTYTLDRVYVRKGKIYVDSSSSDNNRADLVDDLSTDTIVYILEFLEDYEEYIWGKVDDDTVGEPADISSLAKKMFTVNDSGKKVIFSSGNLYWDGEKFCVEKRQYDFPKKWDAKHVGHFKWGSTAADAIKNDTSTPVGNTFFATDGGAIKGWTVLSKDEWNYLFQHALIKNSSGRNTISIAGKNCIILKPDGFSGTVKGSYTAAEWAEIESAYGLVALPFAGYRLGSSFGNSGSYGYYWSSVPDGSSRAWYAGFLSGDAYTYRSVRGLGFSVRLVSVQ